MVQQIVEHLKAVFNETGYFQKIYPLCMLINHGGATKPVHYIGGGKSEDVIFFSNNEGLGYFRKLNDVTIEDATLKQKSCNTPLNKYSYSIRFVGAVPKVKTSCDSEYSEDEIVQALIASIGNVSGLASDIGAKSSDISVSSFKTVSSEIMATEMGGNTGDFDYRYAVIALDIKGNIVASPACFESLCYGGVRTSRQLCTFSSKGGVLWGQITGNIENQIDLQKRLDDLEADIVAMAAAMASAL